MAETIRDVVIRMQLKQVGGGIKPPKLGPAKLAVDDLHKSVAGLERTEKELVGTNIELFDSFGQLGEGLIRVGRGITLLGISADDDLRKVVEKLAKMQAALDIFTGSVQAVKGMVAVQKALATATAASATATVALTVAMSAYVKPLLIIGGAVAALVGGTLLLTEATENSAFLSDKASKKELDNLQRRLDLTRSLQGLSISLANELAGFLTPAERDKQLTEQKAAAQKSLATTPQEIADIRAKGLSPAEVAKESLLVRQNEADQLRIILDIEKERLTNQIDIAKAEDDARDKDIAARKRLVAAAAAADVIIASLEGRGLFEAEASGRLAELQAPIRALAAARGDGPLLGRMEDTDILAEIVSALEQQQQLGVADRIVELLKANNAKQEQLSDEVTRLTNDN